jgi:hypothetical protein
MLFEEFKPETAGIVVREIHLQATKNKTGPKIKLV